MIMTNQPDQELLDRLYGPQEWQAMQPTLAALKARRAHIDRLIAMLEAEMAMSGSVKRSG